MKKLIITLFVCTALLLTGCQQGQGTEPPKSNDPKDKTVQDSDDENHDSADPPMPLLRIDVRSLAQFEQIREKISSPDTWDKDLEDFVKLVDSIPYVSAIDAKITWINREVNYTIDTERLYSILYISAIAENGDWVRIEYDLLASEASEKINIGSKAEIFPEPVQSKDKKLTVYAEYRKLKSIVWFVDIDGFAARIVYHTDDLDAVTADSMFSNCVVSATKPPFGR